MMKQLMLSSILSFTCVNLILVAVLILVFHIGIWGVWIGLLLAQMTQAFLLYYFVRKSGMFTGKNPASSS